MSYTGLSGEAKRIKESNNISIFDYGKATYEIVFHNGSQEGVDEWIGEVALINARYKTTELVRYIVNTAQMGNDQIPIMYVFRCSQDYVRDHPERPITRTLIFHVNDMGNSLVGVLNIFTNWLSSHSQEAALFLPIERQEDGIEWLLGK
jgi:hypothetical protein